MHTSTRPLTLSALRGNYAILRLAPGAPVPAWATKSEFFSVTRTPDELSIVCALENVPFADRPSAQWLALKVQGPFQFDDVGVLANLATPLAAAHIGIFVIATFDTDYVLVQAKDADRTIATLQAAGHTIVETNSVFKDTKENEG